MQALTGENMNISSNIKKSEELAQQVEAFLKSGGKIKKYKMGQTGGHQPLVSHISIKPQEPNSKAIVKARRSYEERRAQLQEQRDVMAQFEKRAACGHYMILAKRAKVSRSAITNLKKYAVKDKSVWRKIKRMIEDFDYPDVGKTEDLLSENLRIAAVKEAKKQALANGLKEFEAICSKHGQTAYIIDACGSSKCRECLKINRRAHYDKVQAAKKKARGLV